MTHAVESYTARPFSSRKPPENPALRPIHQGANPYSDMGSLQAIRIAGKYLERAVADADDHEARNQVMDLVRIFDATVLNVGANEMIVSLSGSPNRVDDFEALLEPFGIVEVQRTGTVALASLER